MISRITKTTPLTKHEAPCAAHELHLRIDSGGEMSDQTSDHGWAPLVNVCMEIQFAPDVGAETLVRLVKSAIMNARLALKVVGLDLGQRLRPSPLIELSRILLVDGGRLARRGLGNLAEEQLGTSAVVNGHLTSGAEKSIGLAKSRRNKTRRRLVKKALLK